MISDTKRSVAVEKNDGYIGNNIFHAAVSEMMTQRFMMRCFPLVVVCQQCITQAMTSGNRLFGVIIWKNQ